MDTTNTLWLETLINDLYGEASCKRDGIEGYWDGYCSPFLPPTRTDEDVRNDIRRRQRMAEACYDV